MKGAGEVAAGGKEGEFGMAEGGGRGETAGEGGVEGLHELGGGDVGDIPESGDDVAGAGAEESPGKTDQAFAGVGTCAGGAAGGDGDEFGVELEVHDVAGVEFVGTGGGGEDDGGIEWGVAVGGGVGGEMDEAVAGDGAREEGARGGVAGGEGIDGGGEGVADELEFAGGVGERGEVGVGGQRVTDEEEVGGMGLGG